LQLSDGRESIIVRMLYSLALYLLSPLLFLYFIFRGWRERGYWQHWGQRLGIYSRETRPGGIVVHAVSMGEVNAAEGLIRQLMILYPELPVMVTCFTPTGSRRIQALFGSSVTHLYWPLDLPGAVRRFLHHTRPRLLIILETEIWPNFYARAQQLAIPLLLVNARISDRSFARYHKFYSLTAGALACTSGIGAQSAEDLRRLQLLGAPVKSTQLTGNLKYELQLAADLPARGLTLRQSWGADRPVWLAASTREGEEAIVLAAFGELQKSFPEALLIIVPRHPQRFEEVAALISRSDLTMARHSQQAPGLDAVSCYLVDVMGELLPFYAACDVAFVGGSLAAMGGHNVLEAAALARPVLVGPNTFNFAEITQQLIDAGGALRVSDADSLQRTVAALLADPDRCLQMGAAAQALMAAEQGALRRTLDMVARTVTGEKPAVEPPERVHSSS